MICICHKDSLTFKSVEHIIPESPWNKHHYLPKGYVCDKCNRKDISFSLSDIKPYANKER